MFWDLTTLYEEGSSGNLHIIENEFLGKGGFGFVCKGELRQEVSYSLWLPYFMYMYMYMYNVHAHIPSILYMIQVLNTSAPGCVYTCNDCNSVYNNIYVKLMVFPIPLLPQYTWIDLHVHVHVHTC